MKNRLKVKRSRSLSNYEVNVLLPILMKGLEMKKGKENAVTNKQIVHSVRKHGVRINSFSVILLVNHIRTNDLMVGLMATSNGYYVSSSEQELIDYEMNLMCREVALRKVRMSMQRQRRSMFSQRLQRQAHIF